MEEIKKRLKELVFPGLEDVYTIPQNYEDLEDLVDENGNIIFKVNKEGVRTTALTVEGLYLHEGSTYGTLEQRDNLSSPVEGQLFFVLAD